MSDHVIKVDAASRSYEVHVGQGLLASAGALVREACGGKKACVITDTHVGPLYAQQLKASLEAAGYTVCGLMFEAGEASKHAGTWLSLVEGMAEAQMGRDDVVVALGGGVVGDMAGFAAATYMRGCQVAQVPTSLLAMVDSSVGGKTAIDLSHGKNLAGAFLQPSVVVADVSCLSSLSPELFRDSVGEVIKHGVLADPELFADLCSHPLTCDDLDRVELVVARNIEIKRDVVNADERERGLRQTLNLGHTLGHAIEAGSRYELGHGSSVAAGLCCVARASCALGICSEQTTRTIIACVAAHGLPTTTTLTADEVYRLALSDKKRHDQSINVVVPCALGSCEVRKLTLTEFRRFVELALAD